MFTKTLKGIYTFNITKWRSADPSSIKVWCNNTVDQRERNFLVGHLKHSNLLMIIAEDEEKHSKCMPISKLVRKNRKNETEEVSASTSGLPVVKRNHTIKKEYSPVRYRANSGLCYDYFVNESHVFKCNSAAESLRLNLVVRLINWSILFSYLCL